MPSSFLKSGLNPSVCKGMSASLGAVLLWSHGGAILQSRSFTAIAQTNQDSNPQRPDVVIESEPAASSEPRFTCEWVEGEYTVMYNPENQPEQAYPWAIPSAMGGGWTPQKRCLTISERLESYRPDGLLELRTGVENNYDVVCVTTEAVPSCRIVFTIPPGQDPLSTRDRVFENLTVADSGQITQGVNTYVEGNAGVNIFQELGQILTGNSAIVPDIRPRDRAEALDLRPFLSPRDGGTGERLTGGIFRRTTSPRLSPDRFR